MSALAAWRARHAADSQLDAAIRRGALFLLQGRDATGGWFSTQATLRAMHAIADASSVLGVPTGQGGRVEVRVHGRGVRTVALPADPKATNPILVDLSAFLAAGGNTVALVPAGSATIGTTLARLTSSHWIPWNQTKPRVSSELLFQVSFDRLDAPAGQPVRCAVAARRVGFRGYGMLLAEVGLPPGAEVDRASLQSLLLDPSLGVDHYEVLPDRVVFYLWPEAGGSTFDFFLTARYPMKAKSGVSVLYDYYNPEALAEVPPASWTVK